MRKISMYYASCFKPSHTLILFVFFSTIALLPCQALASENPGQESGKNTESFHVHPALKLTAYYNDNIYATENSTVDDYVTVITPTLNVHSVWDKHKLVMNAGAEIGNYLDNSSENYQDLWFNANGRYEVSKSTVLFGKLGQDLKHESRGDKQSDQSPDSLTTYDIKTAQLGARHTTNNYTVRFVGTLQQLDYDNVDGLYNDDRDRSLIGLGVRLSRTIDKQTMAFVQGLLNQRNYDDGLDQYGYNRDSAGYAADLGIKRLLGSKNRFEGFVGFLSQNYDDPGFDSIFTANYGANLRWHPADNYKFTAKLNRSLNETTEPGASAYLYSKINLQLDRTFDTKYEGYISYQQANSDYQEVSRDDTAHTYNVGFNYRISSNILLSGGYNHISYDSNDDQYDYNRNLIFVSLKSQLPD